MFSGTCTPINDIHAPPYTGSMHLAFIMIIQQLPMLICFPKNGNLAIAYAHFLSKNGNLAIAYVNLLLKMAIWQFSIVRSVNFDVLLIAVHTHNTYIFCCPKSVPTARTLISSRG